MLCFFVALTGNVSVLSFVGGRPQARNTEAETSAGEERGSVREEVNARGINRTSQGYQLAGQLHVTACPDVNVKVHGRVCMLPPVTAHFLHHIQNL